MKLLNMLFVRPAYPDNHKEEIHHKYFPIGLIKKATYYESLGHDVEVIFGIGIAKKVPHEIHITSLFTYWREYLINTIEYYKFIYPEAKIIVGGVDASLNKKDIEALGVKVFAGIMREVEDVIPDYKFLPADVDFQVLHAQRSCIRRCKFCGTYRVDGPVFTYKTAEQLKKEIFKRKITFYDNNILANPCIKDIFRMLAAIKIDGKVLSKVESKSGFDARLLIADYNKVMANGGDLEDTMVYLIKKARFITPRIAWDNGFEEIPIVEKAINLLVQVGYEKKEIQVFMIYNHELDFVQMEYKRRLCAQWKVQISDCRYRPLNSTFDNYDGKKSQSSSDYFIHENWTDSEIKEFRKRVRGQNIMIRFLAKDRPIILDYFRENNVAETVLREYCKKTPWQENSESEVHYPELTLVESA